MYQPDGTSFQARLLGDEFSKVLTTAEGHVVAKCDDGFYRLASFTPEGVIVRSDYKPGDKTPSQVLTKSLDIVCYLFVQ